MLNFPSSKIITTHTLEPIELSLKDADQTTLVIFDVDDVLLMPTDSIYLISRGDYFNNIMEDFKKRYTEDQIEKMINAIMIGRPVKIVDSKIISIIKSLQKNDIPVMALTALSTGAFDNNKSFVEWRIQQLKEVDITFNNKWNALNSKKFTNLKAINPPEYKGGILFSSGIPKGDILQSFLFECNLKPKRIIFLDDRRNNLESVKKFCDAAGIEFLGFEYTAVKEIKPADVDLKRAALQIEILQRKLIWLSDHAADQVK